MATTRLAGALAALAIMTAVSGCHGSTETTPASSSKSSSFYPTRNAGAECPTNEWRARDPSGLELECWQRNSDKPDLGSWWAVHVKDGDDAIGSPCPRDGIPGLTRVPVPAGSKPGSGFRLLMCQDGKWKNTPEGWPEGNLA